MFTSIVWKLEMEYWVSHCGNDAYLYLLFQRRFGKLTIYLTVISILTSVAINSLKEEEVHNGGLTAFFDRAILDNKEMTDYRSWYHVGMVFIITSFTIRAIQTTRKDARESYRMQHEEASRNVDHEWLKARTLHIKGIPAEDRTGNGLKNVLDDFLRDKDGKVVAIQIVPPFSKIFDIETKIKDLKYLQMLTSTSDQHFFCCVPSKYM